MRTSVFVQLTLIVVNLGSAVAQAPNSQAGSRTDSLRAEVVAALEEYYDALSDRDWDRFRRTFWGGGIITALWGGPQGGEPSARTQSVADFIAAAPSGPGSREIFEEQMITAEVDVRGAIANVFVRYRARFGDPGDLSAWEGVDSFVLMKARGEWRIVALTFVPGQ